LSGGKEVARVGEIPNNKTVVAKRGQDVKS